MWKGIFIVAVITIRTTFDFYVMQPFIASNILLNNSILKSLYFGIFYCFKWQFEYSRPHICASFIKCRIMTRPFCTTIGVWGSVFIKCQYNSLQLTVSIIWIVLLILIVFPDGMFFDIWLHCSSVSFHSMSILDFNCIMFKRRLPYHIFHLA